MNPLKALLGAFVLVSVLMMATTVVDTIASDQSGLDEQRTRDAVLLGEAGEFVTIDDGQGTDETVYKTTGYAVNLTGAEDSYVQSKATFDIATDGNWTVSVWARADSEAASDNMTAVSLNGRVLIWWNGSAGNWSAWYFDEGSRDSYRVNVSDNGEQPGNFTNVIVTANETTFAIYRNNTLGETADLTADSITDAPVNSTNWNGRLEELRTFDTDANNSKRQELVDTPVEQQPDLSPTSRAMFDQPDRSTQLLLYTETSLEQSNVTFSDGFAEQVMDGQSFSATLLGTTDYRWQPDGPEIQPVSGNELDGAPVVYVDYTFEDALDSFIESWASITSVASVIPLIAIALAFMVVLRRVRG